VFLVFFGDARWETARPRGEADARAESAHEPAPAHGAPGPERPGQSGAHGDFKPHESPWVMAFPLVALAVLAAVGGVLNLPFGDLDFLGRWLEPVVHDAEHHLTLTGREQVMLIAFTLVWVAIGMGAAYLVYLRHKVREQAMEPALLRNGWYVDRLYQASVERPGRRFASFSAFFVDAKIIDGAVNGVGALVRAGGSRLRALQTGYVRNYALVVASGAVLVLAYVVVRAGV
jgi:NADH-quinone oxidoreductase subunit L